MNSPSNCIRIGHFLSPHGITGAVKLFVIGDTEQLLKLSRVWIEQKGWLQVRSIEALTQGALVTLAGISSRDMALSLRGLYVYADESELPNLPEGHFYYHELRGLPVFFRDEQVGVVQEIEDLGYQDVLTIALADETALVPLQAPYVILQKKENQPTAIVLDSETPEGLLPL